VTTQKLFVTAATVSTFLFGMTVATSIQPPQTWSANAVRTQGSWNSDAAAKYMDGRAQYWLNWGGAARGKGTACISCHTSLPIALARPELGKLLGEKSPGAAERGMIANVDARVAGWDDILSTTNYSLCYAYYPDQKPAALGTESVMNSMGLVNNDALRSNGILSPASKTALSYLWQEQQSDGSWKWLEFGLKPWESDGTYYGAALAAVTVGVAGHSYYSQPNIQSNILSLRSYLRTNYASRPLHDRVACLWASTYLPGIMSSSEQQALIQQLYGIQKPDGGWSLQNFGAQQSNPNGWGSGGVYPAGSVSDGFATGLTVLALKRVGGQGGNQQLKKAVAWLESSETGGSWPTNYINGPRDPQSNEGCFMRDAATSFAVLALSEPVREAH
jgi:squalene-hopene/tetraprenyl-beta-curcumene cyclase